MSYLQEQLNYIYLQEDLKNSAEEIIDSSDTDSSKKPSAPEAMKMLKKVPNLNITQIKAQASRSPHFKKYYEEIAGL